MSGDYVSEELRRQVYKRAGDRCEYCRIPDFILATTMDLDHIVAKKHGGEPDETNLCLACPHCNQHKGSDLTSFDPETRQLARLFDPRREEWGLHFRTTNGKIEGLTPTGRTTVRLLQMNYPPQVEVRRILQMSGYAF